MRKAGTQPLLRLPLEGAAAHGAQTVVDVRVDGCDFTAKDPSCCLAARRGERPPAGHFDATKPTGLHRLRLDDAYDFAVGAELLHVAATNDDAAITKCVLKGNAAIGARVGPVSLARVRPDDEASTSSNDARPQ